MVRTVYHWGVRMINVPYVIRITVTNLRGDDFNDIGVEKKVGGRREETFCHLWADGYCLSLISETKFSIFKVIQS